MGGEENFESTLLVKVHSTKVNPSSWIEPTFLGWKTWVELQPMEHNRTSRKSVPFFGASLLEPEFCQDLVWWSTCMSEVAMEFK